MSEAKKMTEAELRKFVGLEICEHNDAPCSFCMMKVDGIFALFKEADYAQLDEDQNLPKTITNKQMALE